MRRLNKQYQQGIVILIILILLVMFISSDSTYTLHVREAHQVIHETHAGSMKQNDVDSRERSVAETLQCTMQQRAAHVRDMCTRYHGGDHHDYLLDRRTSRTQRYDYIREVFVNDEHKLLACFNGKAGSSTFKTIMTRYSQHYKTNRTGYNSWDVVHGWDYLKEHNISYLHYLNEEEILHRLKTYTRVTFVRHPLVRVYSAYKQKLATEKPPGCQFYQETMGVHILKNLRKNLTEEELKCGYTVTFPEFIEYFVGEGLLDIIADDHFLRFSDRCHPCFVNYDFIVKLETAETDQETFINRFMNPKGGESRMFHVNEGAHNDYAVDNYSTLLKQYAQVNSSHIKTLLDIYKKDMDLFGYTARMTKDGLRASCRMNCGEEQCC